MNRSKWKGPYIGTNSLKALKKSKKNYVKIRVSRNTTIIPKFIDQTLEVHNGKKLIEIIVTEKMIGHKFGEFSSTRKPFSFKKIKTKK